MTVRPTGGSAAGGADASGSRWTEITLAAMRFHVCVGVLPHEREHPQPLEIDVTVRLASDTEGVLDYRAIYSLAEETVRRGPLHHLEQLCDAVAERALQLAAVTSVRVGARKPHVALAGPLAYAEVVVERARG